MREAVKSAAPEGEHGVLNHNVKFFKFFRLLTKSWRPRPFRRTSHRLPAFASICHRLPAFATIATELAHRFLCDVNARNALCTSKKLRWQPRCPKRSARARFDFSSTSTRIRHLETFKIASATVKDGFWATTPSAKNLQKPLGKSTFWLLHCMMIRRWQPRCPR